MLMQDILKGFNSFKINNHFDLCFIESNNVTNQYHNITVNSNKKMYYNSSKKIKHSLDLIMKMLINKNNHFYQKMLLNK